MPEKIARQEVDQESNGWGLGSVGNPFRLLLAQTQLHNYNLGTLDIFQNDGPKRRRKHENAQKSDLNKLL